MKWCGLVLTIDEFNNAYTICRVIRDTEEETQKALVQSYCDFLQTGIEDGAFESDKMLLSEMIADLKQRGYLVLLNEAEYSKRTVMVFPLDDYRI